MDGFGKINTIFIIFIFHKKNWRFANDFDSLTRIFSNLHEDVNMWPLSFLTGVVLNVYHKHSVSIFTKLNMSYNTKKVSIIV